MESWAPKDPAWAELKAPLTDCRDTDQADSGMSKTRSTPAFGRHGETGEKQSILPKLTQKKAKTREEFTGNLGWWAALFWVWLQPSQAISQRCRSSYRWLSVTLEGSPNVNTARASLPPGRGTYFCSQFMNLWRTVPMTQPWKAISFIYYA